MSENKDWQLEEELAQAKPSLDGIRRVGSFLRPYRKPLAGALAMEVVWCLSYLLGPHLVRLAVDEYLVPGAFEGLVVVGLLYAGNAVFRAVWIGLELRLLTRSGQRILGDLRRAVFDHVQELSMRFFDKNQQGRIISRVDRDVDALEGVIVWGPVASLSAVLLLLMGIGSMVYYDWRLTLVVVACVPTLVISSEVFRRAGMRAYREARAALSRVTAHYAESINGMRVIQASTQEGRSVSQGSGLIAKMRRAAVRTIRIWSAYLPVVAMHYGISGAVLLGVGGRLVLAGEVTLGELVAFILLLEYVFSPVEDLGELYNDLLSASAAGERIFQVLDTEPDVRDRADALRLDELRGRMSFENVRFRYDRDLPEVVQGVSFSVEPGQTVAVVGHTGAGKTTVVGLLCRFYDVSGGAVKLDGHDVRDVRLESLRRNVAMIPQDGYLFSGTVMENLRFGRPEASDAELIEAAKRLGAHEALAALPGGYGAEVGERGAKLSHGQRQMVCYVRALLSEPAILVLDEATSALDSATERTLQEALARLSEGRTTVIIAHRLSTIRNADKILVFDQGRVVEQGRHRELMDLGGCYARLYADYSLTPQAWMNA